MPNNIMRVAYSGLYNASRWANVLHVEIVKTGVPTTTELTSIATSMALAYETRFLPLLNLDLFLTNVDCLYQIDNDSIHPIHLTRTSRGVVANPKMPAQVACCISWQITNYYRGGKPRTYLSGVPQTAAATEARFTSTFANAVNSAAIAYLADVNAIAPVGISDVNLGTVSYVRNKQWRSPPVFYPYQTANVDIRMDTIRRRLGPDL